MQKICSHSQSGVGVGVGVGIGVGELMDTGQGCGVLLGFILSWEVWERKLTR